VISKRTVSRPTAIASPPRARHVEIEWQFAVADLEAFRRWIVGRTLAGWAVVPRGVVRLSDTYVDTADWRVWRSGHALRLRRSGARVEVTLKGLTRGQRGLARRREITSPVPDARVPALRTARGQVAARVRTIAGDARLRRLFALRTRRQVFAVRHGRRNVAELALDATRIAARGKERRLWRVEVEVKAGPPALVARFVATLRRRRHLRAAKRSKFEEGLAIAGLRPPRRR
jgi:inorganic triphosphatase YgiF